jgi:hypothetical protein
MVLGMESIVFFFEVYGDSRFSRACVFVKPRPRSFKSNPRLRHKRQSARGPCLANACLAWQQAAISDTKQQTWCSRIMSYDAGEALSWNDR